VSRRPPNGLLYLGNMTADRDLHQMLDRLTPGQAAAVRMVIAEFIAAGARASDADAGFDRRLPFAGKANGPTDLAARTDEIVRARFLQS
jgi:hypothetical protein